MYRNVSSSVFLGVFLGFYALPAQANVDLVLTSKAPTDVFYGDLFTVQLSVKNQGTNPTTGVNISFKKPKQLVLASSSGGTCSDQPLNDSSTMMTCTLANLAAGQTSAPLTVSYTTTGFATLATVFGIQPTASSAVTDSNTANNAVSHSVTVSDRWERMPGGAKDIAVGPEGSVWIVGTNPVTGGYGLYKWSGSAWSGINGGGVRIAVDPKGNPWVLTSDNFITRCLSGDWTMLPGKATDIGIGPEGSVWIVGTNPVGGGYGIYKWNGTAWAGVAGGAVRIGVGAQGEPWIINDANAIFRMVNGSWSQLSGTGKDISNLAPYLVGTAPIGGGYGLHIWNGSGWVGIPGGGISIASNSNNKPWLVNDVGAIFRHR